MTLVAPGPRRLNSVRKRSANECAGPLQSYLGFAHQVSAKRLGFQGGKQKNALKGAFFGYLAEAVAAK